MDIILDLFVIVFGILSIILFFKIWNMCNDVKEISTAFKEMAKNNTKPMQTKVVRSESGEPKSGSNKEDESTPSSSKFEVGQRVIVKKDESQFKIADITQNDDGDFLYYSQSHNRHFMGNEIEDFKTYWNNK